MAVSTQKLSDVLPPLIFGTATFNNQYNKDPYVLNTTGLVQQAFAHGIRAFDTSPYYGPAEELLGQAFDTPEIRNNHAREDFFILSKVGRVAGDEFDYSAAWVRHSIQRSLSRLRTTYLDVVYCHDVEFVSPDEALEAITELRRLRDEEGKLKYIGISGYPIETLCQISERVLRDTGEPLDIVQSYANYTLQNTSLLRAGIPRLIKAGVSVVPNASPLGMGLLRRAGPPIGLTDFHPAGHDLRIAIHRASDFCDGHDEKLEKIAIRWALESWLKEGAAVGARGDPASGVPFRKETIEELGGHKLGVSVMGVSKLEELQETMRIWRSILDGLEGGQETANAAGRWRKDHEWSLTRQKAVNLLAEGIQENLGDWLDHTWPSPPPGFVDKRKPPTPFEGPLLTPETSPPPQLDPAQGLGEPGINIPLR